MGEYLAELKRVRCGKSFVVYWVPHVFTFMGKSALFAPALGEKMAKVCDTCGKDAGVGIGVLEPGNGLTVEIAGRWIGLRR